jgi:hypothetical protein
LPANEALDVLGLKRGATQVEIKEAYRDLVKVWHPDRFGSDARLRRKAEEKLKEINDAYRVLQSRSTGAAATEKDAGSAGEDMSFSAGRREAPIRRSRRRGGLNGSASAGWIKGCVSVALIVSAGYWVLEREPMHAARPSPAPAQQAGDAGSEPRAKDTVVHAGSQDSVRSNHSSAAQFQVRSLSEAETERVESACLRQKESHDQAAYQTCVRAQLDAMTGARVQSDLSGLSAVERESLESACSKARGHGAAAYNLCVRTQMAELAAEPARPDMSTLNAADRDSIELACRTAKYRDGPSAYDRCRAGMIKLLADSR